MGEPRSSGIYAGKDYNVNLDGLLVLELLLIGMSQVLTQLAL